ncbi:MAG: class 1 fructose-bisphosphatase [Halobacteriales archaeon]
MTGVDAIVETVAEAAPEIRAGLPGRRTAADEENPSGEVQLAADVWADQLLADRLADLDAVGTYASEERETVADVGTGYAVALDPLDGSSNLKSNNPMGTVLAVYDAPLPARGRDLVAAGFVLYGPITTMVVARDGRVTNAVVEDDGSRRIVDDDLTLPDDPTVYGFGGRVPDWTDAFAAYAEEIERELKLRYGGAMIADVNQVLTYGGVFAYPELRSRAEGKLRVQFEANPMAYIIEAAGGASTDGERSLLDVEPTGLHQRTPMYVGNRTLIERREAIG